MTLRRPLLAVLLACVAAVPLAARVPAPPSPKVFDVQLRYRIHGGRNDRIVQFFELVDQLERVGFKKEPGPENEAEDSTLNRMTGTIASRRVPDLFRDPRVKSVLLTPQDYKLPADDQPVRVQIQLTGGYPLETQRLLALESVSRLREMGFKESIGYDHQGFTRLVGIVPASSVPNLFFDLRGEPAGWFVPQVPRFLLPKPLRDVSPLQVVEVIPWPEGVEAAKDLPPAAPAPAGQEFLDKMSLDLRTLLGKEGEGAKFGYLEFILVAAPSNDNRRWADDLVRSVPQIKVVGRAGPVVTVRGPFEAANALAKLPLVSVVRLPVSGVPLLLTAEGKNLNSDALAATGLARLHQLGYRGKGVRVAVIAGDFRGYEALVGKQLPASTKLLDLTATRSASLEPELPDDKSAEASNGTQYATAVALAAPDAELLLIRVDPSAPYQLLDVARLINGDTALPFVLALRLEEIEVERFNLRLAWEDMIRDRNALLEKFGQDEDTQKLREEYREREKKLREEDAAFKQRVDRYLKLVEALRELRRIQVVVSPLTWQTGWATDGDAPLSRYLDDRQFRNALWFQPAGETRGQVWAGLFRDVDRNGVMEFAAEGTPLKPDRWSRELNFLAWKPSIGKGKLEIPEKTTVRVTVQWREAHDPSFLRRGEDLYLQPLADVRLLLLRQRDPSGDKLPADDLELVAQSTGTPLRIDNRAEDATYEQVLEYTVPADDRFALRVEGHAPFGVVPSGVPSPEGAPRLGEMRPRIFLEVVGDVGARAAGRVVFLDYPTTEGTIGMPGDARGVVTVGSPSPSSSPGPAINLQLLLKPNFLAPDALELPLAEVAKPYRGTALSASFAGGLTASVLSTGMPMPAVPQTWPLRPGEMLRVPPEIQPPAPKTKP
jgi:hypothetical protein